MKDASDEQHQKQEEFLRKRTLGAGSSQTQKQSNVMKTIEDQGKPIV